MADTSAKWTAMPNSLCPAYSSDIEIPLKPMPWNQHYETSPSKVKAFRCFSFL